MYIYNYIYIYIYIYMLYQHIYIYIYINHSHGHSLWQLFQEFLARDLLAALQTSWGAWFRMMSRNTSSSKF